MLARADASGALTAENGRVEIRYKPKDGRKYAARADNLSVIPGAVLPDDHCGEAASAPDAKSAKAAKVAGSSAGDASGAAAVAAASTGAGAGAGAVARPKRTAKPKASGDGDGASEAASEAPSEGAIHVYADGACSGNPGPAGLGVVILDPENRIEISEYIGQGTNNIAELTAILRALEATAESGRSLVIHTDSSYSIGVLQKGWKAKANQDLIAELRDHLRGRKGVRLVYVPGHAGVRWNERADSLARDAVAARKSARHVIRAAPTTRPSSGSSAT